MTIEWRRRWSVYESNGIVVILQVSEHVMTMEVLPALIMEGSIQCLDFHLRKICFNDYRATMFDERFVDFFLLDARVLKLMRIGVLFARRDRWWCTQVLRLERCMRGSPNAEIRFGS